MELDDFDESQCRATCGICSEWPCAKKSAIQNKINRPNIDKIIGALDVLFNGEQWVSVHSNSTKEKLGLNPMQHQFQKQAIKNILFQELRKFK